VSCRHARPPSPGVLAGGGLDNRRPGRPPASWPLQQADAAPEAERSDRRRPARRAPGWPGCSRRHDHARVGAEPAGKPPQIRLGRQHRPGQPAGWRATPAAITRARWAGGRVAQQSGSSAAMSLVFVFVSSGKATKAAVRGNAPQGELNAAALTLQQHGPKPDRKTAGGDALPGAAKRSGRLMHKRSGRQDSPELERTPIQIRDACPLWRGIPAPPAG